MARQTGKEGSFYVSGVKIADVFDWTYDSSMEIYECTAKGETFQRVRPGAEKATVNVKRYIQTAATLTELVTSLGGVPIEFILYLQDANNAKSKITGQGYVTRGSISAPHDKATDEIELTVDGAPSTPVVF